MTAPWLPLLLGLAGCSAGREAPGWSEAAAVAPTLERLDRDGNHRVDAAELDAVAYAGGDLAHMSTDGDAQLSAAELLAWMDRTDPLLFDREPGRMPVQPVDAPVLLSDRRAALLEELLLFLTAEVQAMAPDAERPTPYHIRQAAQKGDLQSPEAQAILHRLAAGYAKAGRPFPAGLQPLLRPLPGDDDKVTP